VVDSASKLDRSNPAQGTGLSAVRRAGARLARERFLIALVLIAPALILRIVTAAWPFFDNAWLSLHRSNPTLGPDVYIGLDNYRRLFNSTAVRETTSFTILYTVLSTIFELILGLGIALLLNSGSRLRFAGRSLNLIPWAIPVVVTGIAFRFGLDSSFGLFADLLTRVTGAEVAWLLERWPARIAIIGTNVWRNAPFVAIILLAALQTVPEDIIEAARIDGANAIQRFWSITLPLIMPVIISIGVFFLIWQISSFDLVLAMTGGGPGNSTQVLGYQAYLDAFQSLNFGRAAALSMILLVIVAIMGLIGTVTLRKVEARVH
jgi:multiple sugar transport system permease protein